MLNSFSYALLGDVLQTLLISPDNESAAKEIVPPLLDCLGFLLISR
jgi:hypothetical protein